MFSFMDDFIGCSQIKMDPNVARKIASWTLVGNLHYIVMWFGLKNLGATYQRAMTAVFYDMLHDCIEEYLDDIVVEVQKS